MEDFKKRLTNLRMGAKKAVKGTVANMKRGLDGTAGREMEEARKARDSKMIQENFGNEENYRKTLGLDTDEGKDLFTPPYQKAGKAVGKAIKGTKGLFDRLVQMRGGGK